MQLLRGRDGDIRVGSRLIELDEALGMEVEELEEGDSRLGPRRLGRLGHGLHRLVVRRQHTPDTGTGTDTDTDSDTDTDMRNTRTRTDTQIRTDTHTCMIFW